MLKRVITGLITAPLAVLFIWLGGIFMQVAVTLVILTGMYELYSAFSKKWMTIHFEGYAFALIYMAFIQTLFSQLFFEGNGFMFLTMVFILAVLVALVLMHKKTDVRDCVITVFGFFYVCVLLSTTFLLRGIDELGIFLIWLVFISAWGADTGAYFTGVMFGKHKLTVLSPKKTVEGAIGGIVTATIISALFGLALSRFSSLEMPLVLPLALIGAGGAVLSIFGDLAASAIKRGTGIKDYGNIFPGHGGILDRFDSVIFTAPSVYLLTVLFFRSYI